MKNAAKVYLGLGSNLNHPRQQLEMALQAMRSLPKTQLMRHSSFYRSAPVGFADQPDFINAVAELETELSPFELLAECEQIEKKQNRVRIIRNGPRTLDLDILLLGDTRLVSETLNIPHPQYANRLFVLLPLAELLPNHFIKLNETILERITVLQDSQVCELL